MTIDLKTLIADGEFFTRVGPDPDGAALDTLTVEYPLTLDPAPPAGTQNVQALGIYSARAAITGGGGSTASTTAELAPCITASWTTTAWARSGTSITITRVAHGLTTSDRVSITVSTETTPLPLGWYAITSVATDTFVITGVASGASSGTATVQPTDRHIFAANEIAEGDLICVKAFGSMIQNASANFTVRIRVNGTTLSVFSAGGVGPVNDSGTRGWTIDAEYRVSSTPGLVGSGRIAVNASTAAVDEFIMTRRSAGATAVTLTSPIFFDLTVQPSVSSASAIMSPEGFLMWHSKAVA